jgi:hypothetical protein
MSLRIRDLKVANRIGRGLPDEAVRVRHPRDAHARPVEDGNDPALAQPLPPDDLVECIQRRV